MNEIINIPKQENDTLIYNPYTGTLFFASVDSIKRLAKEVLEKVGMDDLELNFKSVEMANGHPCLMMEFNKKSKD